LLCRKNSKEHESILRTSADAAVIHAALLAAGAEPGSPVEYKEVKGETLLVPPKGTRIRVRVQFQDKGKQVTVPAQQWVRNNKTKKDLDEQWVFAGSRLWKDPDDAKKKPIYAADSDGGYICVYNIPTALLDLPINSPNRDPADRDLQPYTERIPALETPVTLILEPQPDPKKSTK
jgi:hypothetical protein